MKEIILNESNKMVVNLITNVLQGYCETIYSISEKQPETAMNILTERERQILLLHLVGGIRHREIAVNLGLPLSTVLSCYQRTLKKLRRYLEGKEYGR